MHSVFWVYNWSINVVKSISIRDQNLWLSNTWDCSLLHVCRQRADRHALLMWAAGRTAARSSVDSIALYIYRRLAMLLESRVCVCEMIVPGVHRTHRSVMIAGRPGVCCAVIHFSQSLPCASSVFKCTRHGRTSCQFRSSFVANRAMADMSLLSKCAYLAWIDFANSHFGVAATGVPLPEQNL